MELPNITSGKGKHLCLGVGGRDKAKMPFAGAQGDRRQLGDNRDTIQPTQPRDGDAGLSWANIFFFYSSFIGKYHLLNSVICPVFPVFNLGACLSRAILAIQKMKDC